MGQYNASDITPLHSPCSVFFSRRHDNTGGLICFNNASLLLGMKFHTYPTSYTTGVFNSKMLQDLIVLALVQNHNDLSDNTKRSEVHAGRVNN